MSAGDTHVSHTRTYRNNTVTFPLRLGLRNATAHRLDWQHRCACLSHVAERRPPTSCTRAKRAHRNPPVRKAVLWCHAARRARRLALLASVQRAVHLPVLQYGLYGTRVAEGLVADVSQPDGARRGGGIGRVRQGDCGGHAVCGCIVNTQRWVAQRSLPTDASIQRLASSPDQHSHVRLCSRPCRKTCLPPKRKRT